MAPMMTREEFTGLGSPDLVYVREVLARDVLAGVPVKDKRVTLPKGQRVRLVFQHADRNLDRHQFNLAATRTDITSQYIDPLLRRTASIDFTVGAQGEAFYRLSCMVPCAAMEFLIDYLIFVEPAGAEAGA